MDFSIWVFFGFIVFWANLYFTVKTTFGDIARRCPPRVRKPHSGASPQPEGPIGDERPQRGPLAVGLGSPGRSILDSGCWARPPQARSALKGGLAG